MNLLLVRWAKLYSNQTPAEKALEPHLARYAIPYRCQHPLWSIRVFPDFVLLGPRIVIEVDDPGHRRAAAKKKDAERTEKLARAGWRVVRMTNDEALTRPAEKLSELLAPLGITPLTY